MIQEQRFRVIFLASLTMMISASPSYAGGNIQFGNEYEYYPQKEKIAYHRLTSYNPYIRFSYRPQGYDWTYSGRILLKEYPYKKDYINKVSTSQSGLYELYATDYIKSGDFIFRLGIGLRVTPYDKENYYGERYERQLRILPQFDYLLTQDSRFYLNEFFYIADSKGSRKNDRIIIIVNVKPVMPMRLVFALKNTVTGDTSSMPEFIITLIALIVLRLASILNLMA
ncbi:hypothetical protein RBH66_23810 [Escherichia coli]|uniref:hypothetical protein n=1 Tax=Escherichia coli TaxID=562 RepID=UPI0021B06B87|nr:hypothetical protein [Escherichia coli]MCT6172846.1 hypothetical protein [Escherichia coli]MCT6182696.1 hypothetical protein [Escherichia coli]MCW9927935.1 hypothetical protein [Escherichia coli]